MRKFFLCFMIFMMSFNMYVDASDFKSEDADFKIISDVENVFRKSETTISLKVEADHQVNISTFKFTLFFDSSKLKFKNLSAVEPLSDDEFKFQVNDNELIIIYLTENEGIFFNANEEKSLLDINLKVLANADLGDTVITSDFDGIGDYEANRLSVSKNDLKICIEDLPSFDCRLESLKLKDDTQLKPEFNSDVYDYEIQVPSSAKILDFSAVAKNENSIIKSNKKKLNKPGSETDIKIDVFSPDKKTKGTYHVLAKREPKNEKVSKLNTKKSSPKVKKSNNRNSLKKTPNSKNDESICEKFNNDPEKILLKQNGFSFLIFFGVIAICVIIWVFIYYKKKIKK